VLGKRGKKLGMLQASVLDTVPVTDMQMGCKLYGWRFIGALGSVFELCWGCSQWKAV